MIARIAGIAALALATSASAHAQTVAPAATAPADKAFGEWALHCQDAKTCVLVQSVADEAHPEIGVAVVIFKPPGSAPILRVVAPLGVLLPQGVGLKIDQADQGRVGFLSCTPEGCVAEAELSAEQIAKLSTAATATFSLAQTPSQGVSVPIGLKGFKEGFAALP
jgi:invasion protein IalB